MLSIIVMMARTIKQNVDSEPQPCSTRHHGFVCRIFDLTIISHCKIIQCKKVLKDDKICLTFVTLSLVLCDYQHSKINVVVVAFGCLPTLLSCLLIFAAQLKKFQSILVWIYSCFLGKTMTRHKALYFFSI